MQQFKDILDRKYGAHFMDGDLMVWNDEDSNSDIADIILSTLFMTGFDENTGVVAENVVIRIDYNLINCDECIAEVDLGL